MVGGGVFKLKPGQWTDDTSMALCLADTLIAGKGQLDKKVLLEKFLRWWKFGENSCTGECFDIGNTTRKALACTTAPACSRTTRRKGRVAMAR